MIMSSLCTYNENIDILNYDKNCGERFLLILSLNLNVVCLFVSY